MVSVKSLKAPMPRWRCRRARRRSPDRPAALPGEGVRLFERDLVVAAVAHPDWKTPLMFIFTMSAGECRTGLEQLVEDGVVEGLRAHQADRQHEAAGHLARLAGRMMAGPRPGSPCRPGRSARPPPRSPRRRPGGWPIGVAGPGGGQHLARGSGDRRAPPSTSCRRPRGPRPARRR